MKTKIFITALVGFLLICLTILLGAGITPAEAHSSTCHPDADMHLAHHSVVDEDHMMAAVHAFHSEEEHV